MKDEEKLERAILEYLSRDDNELETYRSLTTIYEQMARPYAFRNSYFDDAPEINDKEYVRALLDQMEADGLLEARMGERDYERSYRPTDQGIYERSFKDLSLVLDPIDDQQHGVSIDSSGWTGMPRKGMLSEEAVHRLRVALNLVDDAVSRTTATNEEKAQARAYIIALNALAEAPEPPAELIWKIISLAAAIAGIGSLFVGLIDLYK